MRDRRSFWTLCVKEVHRFLNVPLQTVFAPLMTSVLFLSVFTLALRRADLTIDTIPFAAFLACGLLSMSIMQNAFANSSSSIMHSKVLGGLGDVLMAPLSAYEIATAWIIGGVARGLFVGIINALVIVPVIAFSYALHINVWVLAYYVLTASIMMAALGLIAGLYAQKFDQMASISQLRYHASNVPVWHVLFGARFARVLSLVRGHKPVALRHRWHPLWLNRLP